MNWETHVQKERLKSFFSLIKKLAKALYAACELYLENNLLGNTFRAKLTLSLTNFVLIFYLLSEFMSLEPPANLFKLALVPVPFTMGLLLLDEALKLARGKKEMSEQNALKVFYSSKKPKRGDKREV